MDTRPRVTYLLVRVEARRCALALDGTREVMRALPLEALAGAPDYVSGLSVIRGVPHVVVDLGAVLVGRAAPRARFVRLTGAGRPVALAVDAIEGTADLDAADLNAASPLVGGASRDAVASIGERDGGLLLVLEAARIVPSDDELPPGALAGAVA